MDVADEEGALQLSPRHARAWPILSLMLAHQPLVLPNEVHLSQYEIQFITPWGRTFFNSNRDGEDGQSEARAVTPCLPELWFY